MAYQVKVERVIARTAGEVFQALKDGRLFLNCGADSRAAEIDFRVGGKYRIEFKNHGHKNFGEFVEIIPDKKIVFTWCQGFGADQKPDTQVTIELFADGPRTRLVLVHTGFKTQENADNHQKGWSTGVADFDDQIHHGRLRLLRTFPSSVEKLYAACENPESFFAPMGDLAKGQVDFKVAGTYDVPNANGGVKGQFLEIVPGERIKMSWTGGCAGPLKDSCVTLTFKQKDSSTSILELVHEGLVTTDDQRSHRYGWDVVTEKLKELLAGGSKG